MPVPPPVMIAMLPSSRMGVSGRGRREASGAVQGRCQRWNGTCLGEAAPKRDSRVNVAAETGRDGSMAAKRAPNRTLDLGELERPDYRRVVEEMDGMVARERGAYIHPSKRWEYPWALERAALAAGSRVLDAGSGASIFPVYLARRGHAVTALDVEVAHRLGGAHEVRVEYVTGDLTALPFEDAAFDAAFCISVIEHLPGDRIPRALGELRRVVRAGGRLLLTTDFYRDAAAEIWHESPERRFRVDWGVFDEARLRRLVLEAPGWGVDGALDVSVDWDRVSPRMRRYHGYPYTSVGVALVKSGPAGAARAGAAGASGAAVRTSDHASGRPYPRGSR